MAMLTFMYPHPFSWHLWTAPGFKLQQMHPWVERKGWFCQVRELKRISSEHWHSARGRRLPGHEQQGGCWTPVLPLLTRKGQGGSSRWRAAGFVQHHGLNTSCSEALGLTLTALFHPPRYWHKPSTLKHQHALLHANYTTGWFSPNRQTIWKLASAAQESK